MGIFTRKELELLSRRKTKTSIVILLLCNTGIGIEEFCEIRRTDVDPDELIIKIRVQGELKQKRSVYVQKELERLLLVLYWEGLGRHSKYYFCDKQGYKMNPEIFKIDFCKEMLIVNMKHSFEDISETFEYLNKKQKFSINT